MKHNPKQSEVLNQKIKNNGVNRTGTTSGEGIAHGMHQEMDQTKEIMKF